MTVRHKLQLIFILLAAVPLVLCCFGAYQSWRGWERAASAKDYSVFSQTLFNIVDNLIEERSSNIQAVLGNQRGGERSLPSVQEQRRVITDLLLQADVAANALAVPLAGERRERLEVAQIRLDEVRQQIDGFETGGGERPRWRDVYDASTAVIEELAVWKQTVYAQLRPQLNGSEVIAFDLYSNLLTLNDHVSRQGSLSNVAQSSAIIPSARLRRELDAQNNQVSSILSMFRRDLDSAPSLYTEPMESIPNWYTEASGPQLRDSIADGRNPAFDNRTGEIRAGLKTAADRLYTLFSDKIESAVGYQFAGFAGTLAVLFGFALGTGAILYFLNRLIAKPFADIIHCMEQLMNGNLDFWIPDIEGTDEFGIMRRSLYRFKQETRENLRYRAEQDQYRAQIIAEQDQVIQKVADDFETKIGGIVDAISTAAMDFAETTRSVGKNAETSAQQSRQVQSSAEETMADVECMTSSAEVLAAVTDSMRGQMSGVNDQVSDLDKMVTAAERRFNDLSESSKTIEQVVTLISDIAEQTNLLALNATIEAARAGEAGKGFSVVASEVKGLATQTKKATDEISEQIKAMLGYIDNSLQSMREIQRAVETVSGKMDSLNTIADEQGEMSGDISKNVEKTVGQIIRILKDIEQVASVAMSTSNTATDLLQSAETVSESGNTLQVESRALLSTIRLCTEENKGRHEDTSGAVAQNTPGTQLLSNDGAQPTEADELVEEGVDVSDTPPEEPAMAEGTPEADGPSEEAIALETSPDEPALAEGEPQADEPDPSADETDLSGEDPAEASQRKSAAA